MKSEEFVSAGEKLFGRRWKAPLARALRLNVVTVWRYATDQLEIPWLVESVVKQMLKARR